MGDEQRTVRCQSMVNARGRRYGQITDWPDDEATWRRIAVGALRLVDEPFDDNDLYPLPEPVPGDAPGDDGGSPVGWDDGQLL